ncbi:MAG: hypothetical protein HKN23_17470, partial [Verrucomicrobiales bacterium]|nr:hypothetical protein [Verrucomicrobiales bacterium]
MEPAPTDSSASPPPLPGHLAATRPWGPWATLGWGFLLMFAWLVTQMIVGGLLMGID